MVSPCSGFNSRLKPLTHPPVIQERIESNELEKNKTDNVVSTHFYHEKYL